MNMPKTIRLCLFLIIAMPATPARTDATPLPQRQPAGDLVPGEPASFPAETPSPVEPPLEPRTHRKLGLAALGLVMTTLGACWRIHQGTGRRRWRHLHRARSVSLFPQFPGPAGPHPGSGARHRIRRFDYDRFYLHMLRNL
jgi:hypothetical protein